MAYPVLRYSILFVILCFVYGYDEDNRHETIQKEAVTDHKNDKHIIGDDYLGDEFWDQFSPIINLPTIDGVGFVGNHLKYNDQNENDTQGQAIDDNKSISKKEDDKNNKLKIQNDQLKHLDEIFATYERKRAEIMKKQKKVKKSEVWEHFKQKEHSNACNYCHKEIKISNSSTTSHLWEHLRLNHRQKYDSTEYAKTKKEH